VAFDQFYVTNFSVNSLNEQKQEIGIYPNPCTETVTFEGLLTNEPFYVSDAFGRIITQGISVSGKTTLDVSAWKPGFYVLNASGGVRKFIKQ